jgi:hypothetical protein
MDVCDTQESTRVATPVRPGRTAMPSNKNKPDAEEVVMFATRIPKSMKHDLLQLALDKESTVQEIVRFAIENVLTDRPAPPKPKGC